MLACLPLELWCSKLVWASASPRNLLERQTLRPYTWPTGSEPAFEHGQVGGSFTQCSVNRLSLCPPGRSSPRSTVLIQWHWLGIGWLVIVTQHCVRKSTWDWLSRNGAKNTRLLLSSCSSQARSLGWLILHSLQTALPVERNSLFSFIFLFY